MNPAELVLVLSGAAAVVALSLFLADCAGRWRRESFDERVGLVLFCAFLLAASAFLVTAAILHGSR